MVCNCRISARFKSLFKPTVGVVLRNAHYICSSQRTKRFLHNALEYFVCLVFSILFYLSVAIYIIIYIVIASIK